MRLIDAHALIDEINDMWQNHKVYLNNEPVVHFGAVIDLIGAAPVIETKPDCGAQMDELVSKTDELNSSVKIPVISMEDVPKLAKEMEK